MFVGFFGRKVLVGGNVLKKEISSDVLSSLRRNDGEKTRI